MADAVNIPITQIAVPETSIREEVSSERLAGLTISLHEVGLLQPILVRNYKDGYELVAGSRRLRAAKEAGYETILARILSEDVDTLQVQLIENLQREDLNPVERAEAVDTFMRLHNLTKSAAAERLGVPRTTLTDWLDLLDVPRRFRDAVVDNFHGGDSPLTSSHVSEALALGNRLKSPHLAEVLLEAVLQHKLSKAETRQIAAIIRKHRDVSIQTAITAIRGDYGAEEDPPLTADEIDFLPHEENMKALVLNLARSTRALERMNHLSSRFVRKETVEQLIDQYVQIAELTDRALARLRLEEPDLLREIEREAQLRRRRRRATGRRSGKVS